MYLTRIFANWHRHVIPFTLAFRLVTMSTPTALAVEVGLPVGETVVRYAQVFTPEEFLTETNAERRALSLPELSLNEELGRAAMAKAVDMAKAGYWDHFRPSDHKAPWDFITEQGYSYKVAGENLARGFQTTNGITNAWMKSPSHRANLLSTHYTEVGFASIRAFDPKTGERVLLTVQMFGSR